MSTPFPNGDDTQIPEQLPTPDIEVRPVAAGGRIVRANGVDLCAETFGDPADPAILLVDNSVTSEETREEQERYLTDLQTLCGLVNGGVRSMGASYRLAWLRRKYPVEYAHLRDVEIGSR